MSAIGAPFLFAPFPLGMAKDDRPTTDNFFGCVLVEPVRKALGLFLLLPIIDVSSAGKNMMLAGNNFASKDRSGVVFDGVSLSTWYSAAWQFFMVGASKALLDRRFRTLRGAVLAASQWALQGAAFGCIYYIPQLHPNKAYGSPRVSWLE